MVGTQPAPFKPLGDQGSGFRLSRYLPFLEWLLNYQRANLSGDLIAGVIVAVMLVPQSMAYALLAGLPAQSGLYISIVPLVIYGLLGTSRTLAVGPAAMVSLLVATGISQIGPQSLAETILVAITLALLTGLIQLGMGLFRLGFMVNFLSHPVLSGFVSAAGIVIAASQLKHILGIDIPRSEHFYEQIVYAVEHISQINFVALAISVGSIGILLYFRSGLGALLHRIGLAEGVIVPLTKTGPLVVVVLGTLLVWGFGLRDSAGISIVGTVPAGLPPLTMPSFDLADWSAMLPVALTIALVGYMESISIAKSLASKRRQKIDPDQELVALGTANIGAAFTGGYPIAGGLSRSVVNFTAGANTGLASIITAALIGLTLLVLTPLFFYLPNAVLAAIILVAVTKLFDFETPRHAWQYNKADAISLGATFAAVLLVGIETGILVGAGAALALYLWRTSRPHVAIIGRIGETEHFRNVLRHETTTDPRVLMVRIDESLYFPNAQYLEDVLLSAVADNPAVDHLVLVCSAVNYIDTSALEVLRGLLHELRDAGVTFHLAEVKGPVMDRLEQVGFLDEFGRDHIYLSAHQAMQTLSAAPGQ
ncbi:MAG: solute carrier 26 family protein [Chloroflexi bacterium]|nr:solute carrier 26 family protein [Chloroflexota bacterium]